MGHIARAW
uniref:Uncharacterized protein n=1 Tax=Arundo donax TaxID=35708 RepID=A0A0A9G3J9_ARUDO